MRSKTTIKILLDICMTILFLLLIDVKSTGLVFHEIAGLGIFLLFAYHLALNWAWIRNASIQLKYVFNSALFLNILVILVTGILISEVIFPSAAGEHSSALIAVHKWSSYICLGLFSIHIAWHWKYLLAASRRLLQKISSQTGRKPIVKLGAAVLVIIILGSKVLSVAVKPELTPYRQSSNGETEQNPLDRRDRGSKHSVRGNQSFQNRIGPEVGDGTEGSGDDPSLAQYLGSLYCTACSKHCSLLYPQCAKANPQMIEAKSEYQERYGQISGQ